MGKGKRGGHLAGNVGRNVFWPVPNVDSALVYFERRSESLGSEELRLSVFEVVDSAFAQRRKTLRQALAGLMGSPAQVEQLLAKVGIDPKLRGEQLDIHDFKKMGEAWLEAKS